MTKGNIVLIAQQHKMNHNTTILLDDVISELVLHDVHDGRIIRRLNNRGDHAVLLVRLLLFAVVQNLFHDVGRKLVARPLFNLCYALRKQRHLVLRTPALKNILDHVVAVSGRVLKA